MMKAETDVDRTLRARIDKLSGKKGGRKALAEAVGVSVQSISNIVSGVNRPKLPLLVAIADYYGVTVDWLLGREGCKEKTVSGQIAEARGYAMGLRLAADAMTDLAERLHERADKTVPRKN